MVFVSVEGASVVGEVIGGVRRICAGSMGSTDRWGPQIDGGHRSSGWIGIGPTMQPVTDPRNQALGNKNDSIDQEHVGWLTNLAYQHAEQDQALNPCSRVTDQGAERI